MLDEAALGTILMEFDGTVAIIVLKIVKFHTHCQYQAGGQRWESICISLTRSEPTSQPECSNGGGRSWYSLNREMLDRIARQTEWMEE